MHRVRPTSKVVILVALVAAFLVRSNSNAQVPWPGGVNATKTVGLLPPPSCGASSSLSVTTGTTVYFCYTIFNGSSENGTYSLFDSVLGTIVENATVVAGSTDRRIASWVAYANTSGQTVVNNATWTLPGFGTVLAAAEAAVHVLPLESAAVPALAPAGLLALGGVLLVAGLVFLRRIG